MMNKFSIAIIFIALMLLGACALPGSGSASTTAQTPTVGAQNVGRDQGQASGAETGSAATQSNPNIFNIMAAKTVDIRLEPGKAAELHVEGSDDSAVAISGAEFGLMKWGNQNTLSSETSSGGASQGVGGSGVSRESSASTVAPSLTPATPATPSTPATPETPSGG